MPQGRTTGFLLLLSGILVGVGIDVGNDQALGPQFTRGDGQKDDRLRPEVTVFR